MVNLSFDVSLNDGVFVSNDPVNFVDPWGLYSFDEGLQDAADFSAGFGDTLTSGFGLFDTSLTEMARKALGNDGVVDKCSELYKGGEIAGEAWGLGFGAAGGARALGWSVKASKYKHGGGGVNLLKNGTRKFGADWHTFKHKGKMGSRPHYHRGKTKSQMKKHRPYQGGW